MPEAWRLCRAPFADLSGEGARRTPGRWNRAGLPVVYLADHPALCVLEVRVHLDVSPEDMPADYVLLRVSLPEPEDCPELPADTRAAGDAWLRGGASAVLRVPSMLVPACANLLLNPAHAAAAAASIAGVIPFSFDRRLW